MSFLAVGILALGLLLMLSAYNNEPFMTTVRNVLQGHLRPAFSESNAGAIHPGQTGQAQ